MPKFSSLFIELLILLSNICGYQSLSQNNDEVYAKPFPLGFVLLPAVVFASILI